MSPKFPVVRLHTRLKIIERSLSVDKAEHGEERPGKENIKKAKGAHIKEEI